MSGKRRTKGLKQIGKAARLALDSIERARKAPGDRPGRIADARKSAGARGPVDDVPTVGRPAIADDAK